MVITGRDGQNLVGASSAPGGFRKHGLSHFGDTCIRNARELVLRYLLDFAKCLKPIICGSIAEEIFALSRAKPFDLLCCIQHFANSRRNRRRRDGEFVVSNGEDYHRNFGNRPESKSLRISLINLSSSFALAWNNSFWSSQCGDRFHQAAASAFSVQHQI